MSRVCSIRQAKAAVAASDNGRKIFVVKGVDSVGAAGTMASIFAGKPASRVKNIRAVRHVKKVAAIFLNVVNIGRRISRRRRLYRKNSTKLFKAYDKLTALRLPEHSSCMLIYRRPRFGVAALRFLPRPKKNYVKRSMIRVVSDLAQRLLSFALKAHLANFLTTRLANILKSLIHDVQALLDRRVVFCRRRIPAIA